VGPQFRVDHDISMLVPEIWCRMKVVERDPAFLLEKGYLEKLEDSNGKAGRRWPAAWAAASPRSSPSVFWPDL